LDELQQATTVRPLARQNKILKGAIAQAADSGNAEMLSGLAGNTLVNSVSMNTTLTLIQNLRQQYPSRQLHG